MKELITILRKWNNPEIRMWINNDEIGIQVTLDDFVQAMKQAVGPVTWVFTKEEFDRRFDQAYEQVIQEIKKQSTKVVV